MSTAVLTDTFTGTMAELVEHLFCDWKVVGSIPSRVIPMTLKIVQSNLNSSNTDGSFTMGNSNSVLSPYGILTIDQEKK